jgi:hypothetical protein
MEETVTGAHSTGANERRGWVLWLAIVQETKLGMILLG